MCFVLLSGALSFYVLICIGMYISSFFLYLMLCAVHVRAVRTVRAGACNVTCASVVCVCALCVCAASLLSCLCEYEL